MNTVGEWVAIVNPRSGGRPRSDAFLRRLENVASRVLLSGGPGHVDALVRSCRDAEGLLVAGGDGTLFEVLQACDRSRQKIVLIPAGRGNSLARDLGMANERLALECVPRGIDRVVDLLSVSVDHEDGTTWRGVSASNVAIGYPADVARGAARWRRFGGRSYAIAALASSCRSLRLRMRCDNGPDVATSLTGLVISNSRYVGPFLGFPSADLFDGVFHTIEMRAGRVRQTLHNLSSFSGLGFYEPGVRKDLRAIDVQLDEPALLKIDGELRTGVSGIRVRVDAVGVTFRLPAANV